MAVNFVPSYRDTVDKVGSSNIGLENGDNNPPPKDVEAEAAEAVHVEKE